jgi:hypothetical protein
MRVLSRLVTVTEEDRELINKVYYLLELTEEWHTYEWPRAQAGSAMAGDDAKANPYQISHLIAQVTGASVDHLHCLRQSMRGQQPDSLAIHLQAPFSLARGAIENASTAMWLMAPTARPERLRRRLRYEWASIKNAESFLEAADLPERQGIQKRKDRVLGLITAAGLVEREVTRNKPGFAEIVAAAGEAVDLVDDGRNFPLILWKMGSAIAHGDTWVISTFDLQLLRALEPGVSLYHMTAPVQILWAMVQSAMTMISLVYQKYAMQVLVHR